MVDNYKNDSKIERNKTLKAPHLHQNTYTYVLFDATRNVHISLAFFYFLLSRILYSINTWRKVKNAGLMSCVSLVCLNGATDVTITY